MRYLFLEVGNNSNRKVTSIYYNGEDLADEQKANAIVVEDVPEPDNIPGKDATLYVNTQDNSIYYEYIDRPLTQEEQLGSLQDENADLMFQNAMQDMSIATLQDENAELMFAIANLQLGGI